MGALLNLAIQKCSNTDGWKRCGIRAVFTDLNFWAWGKNTVWPESSQVECVLGIHSIVNTLVWHWCVRLNAHTVTAEGMLSFAFLWSMNSFPKPAFREYSIVCVQPNHKGFFPQIKFSSFLAIFRTIFNISAEWDPVFKVYIGAYAWHRTETLVFIASMHYKGLVYYFVKCFWDISFFI